MKKIYEAPTVEKIRFNYRDQVVAASGDVTSTGDVAGNTPSTGEQVIGRILEGLGVDICKGYECFMFADSWA